MAKDSHIFELNLCQLTQSPSAWETNCLPKSTSLSFPQVGEVCTAEGHKEAEEERESVGRARAGVASKIWLQAIRRPQ